MLLMRRMYKGFWSLIVFNIKMWRIQSVGTVYFRKWILCRTLRELALRFLLIMHVFSLMKCIRRRHHLLGPARYWFLHLTRQRVTLLSYLLYFCFSDGKEGSTTAVGCTMLTITLELRLGRGRPWSLSEILSSGSRNAINSRELCSSSTSDTSIR